MNLFIVLNECKYVEVPVAVENYSNCCAELIDFEAEHQADNNKVSHYSTNSSPFTHHMAVC